MATVGALLIAVGFLALVVGGLLFVPIARLRAQRPMAKKLTIGGAVAFIVGLVVTPTPTATTPATQPSPPAAIASAPIVVPTATPPAPAPAPTKDVAQIARSELVGVYRRVLAEAKSCDATADALGKAANGGNELATYQAAKEGRDACGRAAEAMDGMAAPEGLSDDATATTEKALSTCRGAYRLRQAGMEKAMTFADGDHRPSVLSGMVDDMKNSQTATLMCVAGFFDAASKAGIDIKLMK